MTEQNKDIVAAIVGRPNTGKSTLFNRLIGSNKSVMDDLPGVTRDRLYARVEHYGNYITLIDTGGYDLGEQHMLKHIVSQVHIAIEEADVVVLVVDSSTGINPLDKEIAEIIRKNQKNVLLAVNKVDHPKHRYEDFYSLGIDNLIPVSSAHSKGLGDLLDAISSVDVSGKSPSTSNNKNEELELGIKVAIAGRPNTGKSTLLNAISGKKRAVTSDIPGTTRDVVDLRISNKYGDFVLLDTAGIRRYSKTESNVEVYSIMRSKKAVESSDVALWVVDASEPFTHQDKKVSEIISEGGTGCLIVMNKKDTISERLSEEDISRRIPYLDYAPIIYVSSKYDKSFDSIFKKVKKIHDERLKRINTGELNRFFQKITSYKTPPMYAGKEVKLKYIVQAAKRSGGVPRFIIIGTRAKNTHISYKRYIISKLRQEFGFWGNPVEIIFKEG